MALCINTGSQHTTFAIDARVDDQEIVIPREAMLVNEMTSSFRPVIAYFVATLYKACKGLVATFTLRRDDRVVVFCYVQLQKMQCGKVCFAL
jgi:hypothetical protein